MRRVDSEEFDACLFFCVRNIYTTHTEERDGERGEKERGCERERARKRENKNVVSNTKREIKRCIHTLLYKRIRRNTILSEIRRISSRHRASVIRTVWFPLNQNVCERKICILNQLEMANFTTSLREFSSNIIVFSKRQPANTTAIQRTTYNLFTPQILQI